MLLQITGVVSGLGLMLTVFLLSPANSLSQILFYLLLFLFCFSFFTLAGVYIRKWTGQRELLNQYFGIAARQGLWFAIIVGISLLLLAHKLFTWLNAAYLILALVFLESYLIAKKTQY